MSFLKKIISAITDLGLRKWSIMFFLIAISIIFRVTGLLTGIEFVSLLKGTAIAFFSSNAIEHVKGIFKKDDMSED